ncbi:MAG TPA: ABC transporter ATP-binding protein [Gaiellaceae bacterium]|nr:ABC transporter ATP-binding protein [Gaiellaceae bacterium]
MSEPALLVRDLRVELESGAAIVEELSFTVATGEIVGLVGESGSGKTTTALALLGYARPGVRIAAGSVEAAGRLIDGRDEGAVRPLRGRLISYVPQDPGNALNPALRVRSAIQDVLDEHAASRPGDVSVERALESVQLPASSTFLRRFPHQLSGGQQQRVTIAMGLACEPPVVVLDEPTTGLDVVTQARVLEEIERLRRERQLTMVYVSHDLAVVAQVADRIAVLYAGRIVEEGPAVEVLTRPRHPYTRGLVASIPDHVNPRRLRSMPGVAVGVGERPPGCAFAPRCAQRRDRCERELPELENVDARHRVRCFEWRETPPLVLEPPPEPALRREPGGALLRVEGLRAEYRSRQEVAVAANDVSFSIEPGGCVALVGESGSGKTTIARCVVGLHEPESGRILLDGAPLPGRASRRSLVARRRIQIVFQNPYDSLNPRHRVADAIARPARILRGLSGGDSRAAVERLLERVRLPVRVAERFPGELSGGERQRVAIARALAANPDLIVCDEITSALDVSVQAAVLELLAELRSELGLALLFISHDLAVVASIADWVLVLEQGVIQDEGPIHQVLSSPRNAYTRRLLDATPRLAV